MRGWRGGWCWSAPRPGTARRSLLADWARRGQRPAGVAVAGRGRQRPGPVLAPCGRRAGPGAPGDRRAGGPAARPARAAVVRGAGDGPDQRAGRRARCGRGAAGPRRLPPDRRPSRCTRRSGSCWSTGRRGCTWCWPAGLTRRWRWRGCGPAGSWPSCAPPSCGSPPGRRRRCCGRRPAPAWPCPMRPWRRWRRAPKGGRPGCSWPRLSLRGQADVAGFVAAFTGSHRYVLDYLAEEVLERQSEQVRDVPAGDLGAGAAVAARCATRSPAAPAARRCWSRWSGPACSWCRWMRCAAGGATTTCSPTCSAPACRSEQPGRAAQLHRNAAAWYEEHGLADDAIRHAVAAGEMTWAARLIEQHFDAVYQPARRSGDDSAVAVGAAR